MSNSFSAHISRGTNPPRPPLSGRETPPLIRGGWEGFKNMKRFYIPYNRKLVEIARENRKNPTWAEKKMWFDVLKSKQFQNYKFHRQKPLDNFIADFYCPELMLVIEIDGDSHARQEEYDLLRSEKLSVYGINVIRYTNDDVLSNIEGVHKDLRDKVENHL